MIDKIYKFQGQDYTFGTIFCATKEEAEKIRTELMKRFPEKKWTNVTELHLSTFEQFFKQGE